MSMFRTGDPLYDFEMHDAEQERQLSELPVCEYCEQPIQDEHLWDIEGTLYHEKCAELQFRKDTDNYGS